MVDNKKKKRLVFLILLIIVITGIGVTYAYFIWNSTSNTDVSLNVKGAIVELDDGKDIKGANLIPTNSYLSKDSIKKDIKIRLKSSAKDTVTVDFKLNINSIDSGLNDSSFKYVLVKDSTVIKEGNFASSKNGDSISLLTLSNSDGSLTTSTSTYTLYIYIDGESGNNPSSMMNKSFDFSLDITGSNSTLRLIGNALEVVSKLDDGSTGDSGSGVYKVEHDAIAGSNSATGSEIIASTDYRYYGASPNNYICLDMEGSNTCPDKHLYRIIGSIYEEKENTNRIKVIKATPLTDGTTSKFSWDYKEDDTKSNIWATITSGNYSNSLTSGASLMILLNSGLWWNGTSGNYYNNSTSATTVNFTNYKLSNKAKSYINISRYYLGGHNSGNTKTTIMYGYERGTKRYDTSRALYWDGYVGLMYPSDYGYAAGNACATGTDLYNYDGGCQNKDWLYNSNNWQWQMSPYSDYTYGAWNVNASGFSRYSLAVNYPGYVFPVFYLSKDISITSGIGTNSDPYIIN